MQLAVTILEETQEAAVRAIRALTADHDVVEVRAERFPSLDVAALRAATAKPIILTHRGQNVAPEVIEGAVAAGIDFVDVEWTGADVAGPRDRIVLSHHDYEGLGDFEGVLDAMRRQGCAYTKLAVTPQTLAENRRVLAAIAPGVTTIGMGERGLYSRILAPFLGAALTFVAPDDAHSAAPSQLTLDRALAIFGDRRTYRDPAVFAIAGDPAGHSLSPSIHNPLFREKGVNAVYTIASFASFGDIADAFARGEIRGLSVTKPFKELAFAFARERGMTVGPNAAACGAVNTLVGDLADNTDVDGFAALLAEVCGRDRKSVAIVGAGGTARAALAAARGMHVTVYNRSVTRELGVPIEPLSSLARFDGEIVIDTTGADIDLPLKPGMTLIEASYTRAPRRVDGVQVLGGLDLLHAQAKRQNDLFVSAVYRA